MQDKRAESIKNSMWIFQIVCLAVFILYAICTLVAYYTLSAAQMEIPIQLKASYIVVIFMLCVLWLWFCVISPISDWCKERRKRKERSEDEENS